MKLTAIVACDGKLGIGKGNDIPWHIPEDFRHFKAETINKTILMGRKTFESLPTGALPKRRNVVLTRDKTFTAPNVEVIHDLYSYLETKAHMDGEIMVIGGGQIYKALSDRLDSCIVTHVHGEYECDTFIDLWGMVDGMTLTTTKDLEDNGSSPEAHVNYYDRNA